MTQLQLPKSVIYYGSAEPLPPRRDLRAGPLDLVFENGGLRYIKLGDREVIRGIYCAVRDQNWGTVPPHIDNLRIDAGVDSFEINYDVGHTQGDVDFTWQGSIRGEADGTIEFGMDGLARSTFLRNRIGFCILHPMRECAGAPCEAVHEDGLTTEGRFPRFISPEAPFQELVAIKHEVTPEDWACLEFSGDIFEMEDQRNWTDASFKTFCTPLRLPFPVEVKAGTRVQQTVRLTVGPARQAGPPVRRVASSRTDLVVEVSSNAGAPVPKIGLQAASHGNPLTPAEIERLIALKFAHLRAEVRFTPGWQARLDQAACEARALGTSLEAAIFLTSNAEQELHAVASALSDCQCRIARLLVFHVDDLSTTRQWVELARRILREEHGVSAPIGGGTNANFMELNSIRPPTDVLDFVRYSLQPQEHAFDNASLVETLEAQRATVESARQFAGGLPVVVSPVTLRKRVNPYAKGAEPVPPPGELPPQVDPRQATLFGACWTLGSFKYLAESGAESVTYYEATGWRGVMEREAPCPLPDRFPSRAGCVFPLYHVLADVGEFAEGDVLAVQSNQTLTVDGLAIRQGDRTRCLVANFTGERQKIDIRGIVGDVQISVLDETNFDEAIQSPEAFRRWPGLPVGRIANPSYGSNGGQFTIDLLPYAMARLDARSFG